MDKKNETPKQHIEKNKSLSNSPKQREVEALFSRLEKEFQNNNKRTILESKYNRDLLKKELTTKKSLENLTQEITEYIEKNNISSETLAQFTDSLQEKKSPDLRPSLIPAEKLPFGNTTLAKKFENAPLGKNIGTDIAGFLYGFFIQGGTTLVLFVWKILVDIVLLPRDIFRFIQSSHR